MLTSSTRRAMAPLVLTGSLLIGAATAQEPDAASGQAATSLMAQEPQTPAEYLDAALLMLRVTRPDLAAHYLQELVAQGVDDATLLELQRDHGTAIFLKLSQMKELQPYSQQLLDQVRAAATQQQGDAARVDALIASLQGTPRERSAALTQLRQLGADAVPPLLKRLADRRQDGQQDLLLQTLIELGWPAAPPLLAALEAPDEWTRATALEALGWVGSASDVPQLLPSAFARDVSPMVQSAARQAIARIRFGSVDGVHRLSDFGAADQLRQQALSRFSGEYEWPRDPEVQVVDWSWDTQTGGPVKTVTSEQAAQLHSAQRLARDAMRLSPTPDNQALFLATSLAEEGQRAGWENPWPTGPGSVHELAIASGPELTQQALQLALDQNNPLAAVGSLKALGQTGTRSQLLPTASGPAPIVAALNSPSERVQFAAASTVLLIDPDRPFPTANRVVEILTQALSGDTAPQSVVIDPNVRRANEVAGILRSLGFDSRIAPTGRDGFRTAAERTRVDLAVLNLNTIRWDLTQTVANFRADSRTAGVPIAVVGPGECESSVQWLVNRTPLAMYVILSDDADNWQTQLKGFLAMLPTPPLTPEQRVNRSAAASYWLRQLAERSRTNVFPLESAENNLTQAINNPDLAEDALVALTAIPRPSVQRQLLQVAEAQAYDDAVRITAARQLSEHIRRFGVLLTREEQAQVRDAWSKAMDPALNDALAAVFGGLPSAPGGVLQKLESYPLPEMPSSK